MASKEIKELRAAFTPSLFNLALAGLGCQPGRAVHKTTRCRAEADAQSAAQFHVSQGHAAQVGGDWEASLPQIINRVNWGKAQHKTAAQCMTIGRILAQNDRVKFGGEPEIM